MTPMQNSTRETISYDRTSSDLAGGATTLVLDRAQGTSSSGHAAFSGQGSLRPERHANESAERSGTNGCGVAPGLIAELSHELRTAAATISGYTEILNDSNGMNSSDRMMLQAIATSSRHLLDMLDSMLDATKIEAGQFTPEAKKFQPEKIGRDMVQMFGGLARAKGLDLRLTFGRLAPAIVSDENRIRRVLMNLLSNSIKYSDAGTITVDLSTTQSFSSGKRRTAGALELCIQVCDDGVGMSESDLVNATLPFFRSDSAQRRLIPGSGLGLAITRQLVDGLGGRLLIASRKGQGTRVEVQLPVLLPEPTTGNGEPQASNCGLQNNGSSNLRRAESLRMGTRSESTLGGDEPLGNARSGRSHEPAGLAMGGRAKRVLVVEDDPHMQFILRHYLEDQGLSVDVVGDGLSALALPQDSFDMVLLDLRLPELDGLATAAILRKRQCRCAIVAISAAPLQEAELQRHGFSGSLSKSADRGAIVAMCREHLGCEPDVASRGQASRGQAVGESAGAVVTVSELAKPAIKVEAAAVERQAVERPFERRGDRFLTLATVYAKNLRKTTAELRRAAARGDLGTLRSVAHRVAGTSGMYGFTSVSASAQALIAEASREAEPRRLKQCVREIARQVKAVGRQLASQNQKGAIKPR